MGYPSLPDRKSILRSAVGRPVTLSKSGQDTGACRVEVKLTVRKLPTILTSTGAQD